MDMVEITIEVEREVAEVAREMVAKGFLPTLAEAVSYIVEDRRRSDTPVDDELRAMIQEGLDDIEAGRVHDWEDVRQELLDQRARAKAS